MEFVRTPPTNVAVLRQLADGRFDYADALEIGDAVIINGLLGPESATVTRKDIGAVAESDGSVWFMNFDAELQCWTCVSGMNKKAASLGLPMSLFTGVKLC